MGWHEIHGFLAINFILHFLAFVVLGLRKRKPRYTFLCGTFALLTGLFSLKFFGLDPWVFEWRLQALLRIAAAGCTAVYLTMWWKEGRSRRAIPGRG
ncbi:MAG: hypothetical protein VX498_12555 [Myxococcota bacterium]|nr:hypothetical protein [Myxococcota bacterium]